MSFIHNITDPASGSEPGAGDQSWDLDIHISIGFFLDGYTLYGNNRSTITTFSSGVSRVTPTFNTVPQMPYNPSLKIKVSYTSSYLFQVFYLLLRFPLDEVRLCNCWMILREQCEVFFYPGKCDDFQKI